MCRDIQNAQRLTVFAMLKRKRTSALAGDNDHGSENELQCRFKFPKVLSSRTHFELHDKQPELVMRRNDSRINEHNRAQLTGWRLMLTCRCVSMQKWCLST